MMAQNAADSLYIPVKTGFKSDAALHRRNMNAIEGFLQSAFIPDLAVTSLSADNITSGTLTSTVIVSGLLQAPSASGYRVEIGNATYPLRYWNGTTTKLSLDTSGNVVISGSITATAGAITGTLVVSGLLQAPAASGYRVEIGNATYPLRYWNGTTTKLSVDTSGNLIVSGAINDSTGQKIVDSGGYSRVKLRNGAGDTISSTPATNTTMTWVTEDKDTDSYWNGSNDYIIVPYTGQYMILAQSSFASNADGTPRRMKLQNAPSPYTVWADLGGGCEANARANDEERQTLLIGDVIDLTALDGLRMRVGQHSGGNLNCSARLAVVFLGPA